MKTLELKLKKDVLIVDAEVLEIIQALIFNKWETRVSLNAAHSNFPSLSAFTNTAVAFFTASITASAIVGS